MKTFAQLVLLLAAAASVAGCETVSNVFDRRQNATNQELSVEPTLISVYLDDVDTLLNGDAGAKASAWRDVQLDFQQTPTTRNVLRYALAMATPGHSGTDLAAADALLTDLLLTPELLLAEEKLLANVHLGLMRDRITVESTARQARSSQTRNAARELSQTRSQLTIVRQDNERLRTALTEAEDKLRALATIERSIRERNDESNGNRTSTDAINGDE
ncbi:MAG: hypothetical protein AAGA84_09685 [Pseudomonadota bacterium]